MSGHHDHGHDHGAMHTMQETTTEGHGEHDGGHDGHDGHGDMDMGMGHMSMTFHLGTDETILFDFWKTEKSGTFAGSLIIIFFMAFAYEALKYYREVLYRNAAVRASAISVSNNPTNEGLLGTTRYRILSGMHSYQTILHMVQFVLSYFLMLIFMTYNVWLCIAVTLGAGVGYFCFGWNKNVAVDVTDHCQ